MGDMAAFDCRDCDEMVTVSPLDLQLLRDPDLAVVVVCPECGDEATYVVDEGQWVELGLLKVEAFREVSERLAQVVTVSDIVGAS